MQLLLDQIDVLINTTHQGRREEREDENLENKDESWGFLHELGGPIVGLKTFQKKLIHM